MLKLFRAAAWRIGGLWLATIAAFFALVYTVRAETVRASYYGTEMHGRTASGDVWRPMGMSAASRWLPFGVRLRVTYQGKFVDVIINDRGPAKRTGRDLDLSLGAARRLGLIRAGTALVHIQRLN